MNIAFFGNEPRRGTADAAGVDLVSANTVWLTRNWERVKTGTHVAIPSGHVGFLMPRSSLEELTKLAETEFDGVSFTMEMRAQ